MPTGAVLVVRLRRMPSDADVERWRRDVLAEFDPGNFYHHGPLEMVRDANHGPVPVPDGSIWVNVNVYKCYYSKGYERGDLPYLIRLAEWLEQHIPDSEVWYGNDEADDTIKPFGQAERAALLAYYREVGHEPYDSKHRHH